MIDLSIDTFREMHRQAMLGHPKAIEWVWWRKFIGLWIGIAKTMAMHDLEDRS